MRVLFDNNVPAPLRGHLTGHEVSTPHEMGWHELENGDLLVAAERGSFAALVTADQNLSYQQNLIGHKVALVVLSTNDGAISGVRRNWPPRPSTPPHPAASAGLFSSGRRAIDGAGNRRGNLAFRVLDSGCVPFDR